MYNDDDRFDNANPLGGLIKTAIGMAPVGYGAYLAFGKITANASMNPAVPFGVGQTGGNLREVGRGIGGELASAAKDNRTRDLANLKSLTDKIMADDKLQEMLNEVDQQRALVQSVLELMDDPGSNLGNLTSYRERLVDLARNSGAGNPDEMKNILQSVIKAVMTDQVSEGTKTRWSRNLREYKKLGPQLQHSDNPLSAKPRYNSFDMDKFGELPVAAQGRYKELVKALGPGGRNRVDVVTMGNQTYARVYSGSAKGGRSNYLATIPLNLNQGNSPVNTVYVGEHLNTGYAAPRHVIDAQKAATLLTKGPTDLNALLNPNTGAGMGVEDLFLRGFVDRLSKDGRMGSGSANTYRAWQRQFMSILPRISYSVDNPVTQLLHRAVGSAMNIATVTGLDRFDKREQDHIMTQLGTTPGFDAHAPGYQYLIRGIDNEPIGRIGIHEGSPIAALKSIGPANRGHFPVESRIEQVWGRESFFFGSRHKTMGRGGVMTAGATTVARGSVVNQVGKNIEWADALTGATNKAVLLSVLDDTPLNQGLAGQGVALTSGREFVRSFSTKPLLDAGEKNYMTSSLMKHIMAKTGGEEGRLVRLTREEILEHGDFLGLGPSSLQHLRGDPRAFDLHVAFTVTQSSGRRQVNLITAMDRRMEAYKGFSTLHKGVVRSMKSSTLFRRAAELGVSRSLLRGLGITGDNLVLAPGDMLKKGAGFFDLQLRSGFGLVAGEAGYDDILRQLAKTQQYAGLGDSDLAKTTGAVIKGLSDRVKAGTVSAEEAGHVLAAVYTRGFSGKRRMGGRSVSGYLGGLNESQSISHTALAKTIIQAFGKQHAGRVLKTARTGVALGATSMTQGMGLGDYGLGRGSVEPRFITNLQHRLKSMGFGMDEVSNIISEVYKKKIGFAEGIKSASGLLRMTESLSGSAGVIEGGMQVAEGLPNYTLKDIAKLASGDIGKLFEEHTGGFTLDLTAGADTTATRAIAAAAKAELGQGQIFFPGRDVVDAMKDTVIKGGQDDFDTIVHGDYTNMVKGLFNDISSITSQATEHSDNAVNAIRTFKNQAIDLSSRSIMGVARGKIRGMQSHLAQLYDLDHGMTFDTTAQRDRARQIMKRSKGYAAFMDKNAFMSQLNDWMGTTPDKIVLADAASRAERFFLSPERGDIGKLRGVVGIGTRHPELGLGNITPLQFYRHVAEVGSGDKDIFEFMSTIGRRKQDDGTFSKGRWEGVRSWKDVQELDYKKRHGFFYDFVENIGNLAPEGGGSVFLPRTVAEITVGGRSSPLNVDMGVAGAAIGDFDGDQWMTMFTSKKTGKSIMSTMSAGKRESWQRADAVYKIKSELFAEEAKDALGRLAAAKADIGFDTKERIIHGLKKEQAAKDTVGNLNTRLDKLRLSLVDLKVSGKAGLSEVDEALAFLKILQEHANIKGKKLPIFMPFAERISSAVDEIFANGNFADFEDVMKNMIFKDSQLWGGMEIQGVSSHMAHLNTISNEKLNLTTTMEVIKRAAETARVTGVADMPTANWISKIMKQGTDEDRARYTALLADGGTLESAMIAEFQPMSGKAMAAGAENMFNKIGKTLSSMDRNVMGLGVAAIAGTLGAFALLNHQGYGPQELSMPGEAIDPNVRQAIGNQNLFTPRGMEGGASGNVNAYATMGRQISTPEIYMKGPNAYQVRGNIPSLQNVSRLGDYMGTMGSSSGSIRINDTRLPITANYLDRMTGEY